MPEGKINAEAAIGPWRRRTMKRFVALCVRYPRSALFVSFCVVLAVLWAEGMVVTVRPIDATASNASSPASGLAFSPKAYVERIWTKRVLPTVREHSVPLTRLLAAIAQNKKAALHRFGHRVSGSYNMLVRFSGKVSKIDTSTPIGTITVDVAGASHTVPVKVAVGPVILGTTLRDSLKFISFGEFLNQIQYGDVADQLNRQVKKKVVAPLQLTHLKGRTVEIAGAYTYDAATPRNITVTPVILRVATGVSR